MNQLKALEAFVKVVDGGGFSRAAELLGAPKATVSTLVQGLETHLGVRLLHRTTRKVTLTPDGAAYYEHALRILDMLREADEAVSSSGGTPSGRLRVDLGTSMASWLMRTALPDFLARHPAISLELGCTDRLVNLVGEAVDCVIRVGEVQDPLVVARRIGSMHLVTCAAPSYLAAHNAPTHPQNLHQHRCINYFGPGRILPWEFSRAGEHLSLMLAGALAVNDSNVYRDACVAGLGIAQLPGFTFDVHEAKGELCRVMPDWHTLPLPVHALYPSRRHLSPKVQVFVEWAAEVLAPTYAPTGGA